MSKRHFSLKSSLCLLLILLSCVLLFAGCVKVKILPDQKSADFTAEQAEEINTVDNLLKSYQTITYAQLDYIGGYTMHVTYFLNEAGEVCAIEDDSAYSAYRDNAIAFEKENGETYYQIIGEAELAPHLLMVANSEFTSQTTNENGDLLCEMTADIDQDYADALSNWSVTTEDKMLTTVTFAASDHRVLTIDYVILRPDGTKLKIASGVTLYDLELLYPDLLWDYSEAEKAIITVTLADGSTRTAAIPKGASFTWTCDDGYALYTDADGKTALGETSEPVETDMTLYVLKSKE